MSIENTIQKNIELAPLTTYKIGGRAKFFIEVNKRQEFEEAVIWAKKNKKKLYILGGGSNVLINDKGVDGLVIKINNTDIKARGERLDCGAGAFLGQAVSLSVSNSLSGLEWAVGIPGIVGGAVFGNAGAFNVKISDLVETIEVFNIEKKQFRIFSKKDCEFTYRDSIFKKDNNLIIWQVILKLLKGKPAKINSLTNKYRQYRIKNQPKLPSAGSIFKNLNIKIIREVNQNLADEAIDQGVAKEDMVGAGWIIELAGLKGKTIGGAKVSLEHANFIINTGKATSEDVITLISLIKQQVRNRFKIQLQEEVQYFGYN